MRSPVAADGKTGDGCGLLLKFPESFLRSVGEELGFSLNKRFAAGTVFLAQDQATSDRARAAITQAIGEFGRLVAVAAVVAALAAAEAAIGPTPGLDREMANSFGLAAMVLTLQNVAQAVHCLKGNHDNLLDSEEQGGERRTPIAAAPLVTATVARGLRLDVARVRPRGFAPIAPHAAVGRRGGVAEVGAVAPSADIDGDRAV